MRKWWVAIAALGLLTAGCSFGQTHASAQSPGRHPNIVFLLTDDLDMQEVAYMPHVRQLLTDEGVSFSHFYVSVSLCCPSRSSILRGQYSHNTGVLSNGGVNGGFETAYRLGIERSTVGTWLQKAGYRTAYIGKYLNAYPDTAKMTYEPPGWNEFDSAAAGDPYTEYNYTLNQNGHLVSYGSKNKDYGTTVYVGMADKFIRREKGKPFFVYLNVYAPHQPAVAAKQDKHLFKGVKAPRTPAFNELNEKGKPNWLTGLRVLQAPGIATIDALYRSRIRSLQAVDRGVAKLISTLKDTNQLSNTYFVFSSDNGFHLGQFRLPAGKETAYETDIHVPLIVRGPGVPHHQTSPFIFGNIDIAPTFGQLAGADVPAWVDGRSFAAQLHNPTVDASPRRAYLVEHWKVKNQNHVGSGPTEPHDLDVDNNGDLNTASSALPRVAPGFIPEFHGVRTARYLYVEYSTGGRELYDTQADPYELHNLVHVASEAPLVAHMHMLVARLKVCSATVCRRLENAPVRP
jgi:arylsulfatase A-like enzyme